MIDSLLYSPAIPLFISSLLGSLLPVRFTKINALLGSGLAIYISFNLQHWHKVSTIITGFPVKIFYNHPYSFIFVLAFVLSLFFALIFAFGNKNFKKSEINYALAYAGSAIMVVTAGDVISFFLFWELMALLSTLIIIAPGTDKALRAGFRYIIIHLISGVFILSGIAMQIGQYENYDLIHNIISLNKIDKQTLPPLLMLIGVLINTATPPFNSWLPDSYPEASPYGSVFLSIFTTKTAVFVLLTWFSGTTFLIYIGLGMIFYGIIYAILENDIRRILSFSIINQVGFMVTVIGIGTDLAKNGAALHAFCHIFYKSLLMMTAGAVIYETGKRKCSELGGIYRSMRFTTILALIGAASISAVPFTAGFASKTILLLAPASVNLSNIWLLLMVASAGVFLHAGIKFPWFVFFQKDFGLRPKDPPPLMLFAMTLTAIMCIIPGIFPQSIYHLLPVGVDHQPNDLSHIIKQTEMLFFSAISFFLMLPLLKRTETITLDFDWFYRGPLKNYLIATFEKSYICFNAIIRKLYICYCTVKTYSSGFYYHKLHRVNQLNFTVMAVLIITSFYIWMTIVKH